MSTLLIVLYTLCGILGFIALGLILLYIFRPEALILPYSYFVSIFVKNPPFVEKERYFPGSRLLEENWEKIKAEAVNILRNEASIPQFHEVDDIQKLISARDNIAWRTFGLKAFGHWIEPNCAQAPFTADLLRSMPEVTLAMFSILDPGKRIPPHFGFNRSVFRYHLGLIVPQQGECYIVVGKQKYSWKPGESALFDDTYTHEVWNNTSERRVVLFLDVSREQFFPSWLRPLNRWTYNLLANSKRVKNGLQKAEVLVDIQSDNPQLDSENSKHENPSKTIRVSRRRVADQGGKTRGRVHSRRVE